MPAIRDPFLDITAHVEKAIGVGLVRADLDWSRSIVRAAATFAVGRSRYELGAPPVRARTAGTGGIFPFSLVGQPIGFRRRLRQPSDILLSVVPTHVVDGHVVFPAWL